jgi:nitrous oxidase accessory protein NosD
MRRASALVMLCLLSLPARTQAAVVVVPPGTGTLQAAIDAGAPGTTLLLDGVYVGPVVIDEALRITCTTSCAIHAQCQADVAVDIAADGVLLRAARRSKQGAVDRLRVGPLRSVRCTT